MTATAQLERFFRFAGRQPVLRWELQLRCGRRTLVEFVARWAPVHGTKPGLQHWKKVFRYNDFVNVAAFLFVASGMPSERSEQC